MDLSNLSHIGASMPNSRRVAANIRASPTLWRPSAGEGTINTTLVIVFKVVASAFTSAVSIRAAKIWAREASAASFWASFAPYAEISSFAPFSSLATPSITQKSAHEVLPKAAAAGTALAPILSFPHSRVRHLRREYE